MTTISEGAVVALLRKCQCCCEWKSVALFTRYRHKCDQCRHHPRYHVTGTGRMRTIAMTDLGRGMVQLLEAA